MPLCVALTTKVGTELTVLVLGMGSRHQVLPPTYVAQNCYISLIMSFMGQKYTGYQFLLNWW